MPVIMGTAGHIDHGKTTLIKALSGMECDRLVEEKKRGITIELGFAFMDLEPGMRLGIIDVPGHERFVKNMVSGASGIDFVLLVIAADEGVMPQTREHLDVCTLLGVETGLVALTKTDMADPEWLELVQEDVSDYLQDTFLKDAPVVPVSAHTGQGIQELLGHIRQMAGEFKPHRRSDLFRLPMDRIFTMRGHGTVITGTTVSGRIKVGEEVMIYPQEITSKVRSLQVHGEQTQESQAGMRTAVNLHGLEVEDLERGFVLGKPGTLFPSRAWDLELTHLESAPRPLKHRTQVHFHHGAKEVLARIYLLDRDKLEPGERCVCQVRFEDPMAGVYGDRCVIRSYSPLRTIAGAGIINPLAGKVKRFSSQVQTLERLARARAEELIQVQLEIAGSKGLSLAQLVILTDLESKELQKKLQLMGGRQEVFLVDKESRIYVAGEVVKRLEESMLAELQELHRRFPMRQGVSRGELAGKWARDIPEKLFFFVLERLVRAEKIVSEQEYYRLPQHKVSLAADQEKLREKITRTYRQAGIQPPTVKKLLEELGLEMKEAGPVLRLLQDEKELVKINEDFYFSAGAVQELKDKVKDYLEKNEEMGPVEFKEITGLSRKFAIPLMEFMDKEKLTMRVGDKRKLRKRS
ncbi:selenocysteine-specific translation elongation factor [Desulfonatronospira thiodismutans ASO3-1]|uniref:Selenocysteine-specific elongation factor n=1 Tax=Desulfonatronospira thiodismutans ASO3-1 TaxID=555779 RepID=D6SST7_9BACT|nr:selenocysteine-specific translation elongation factor [Desulfonatronospira thiodismutans]EFI33753.1 selenocysteine-specific translation elongation factor [Desulfonatronospira thiodismutans ASO3-1]